MAEHRGSEGSDYTPQEVFERNKPFIAEGDHSFNTDLGEQEPAFRSWVSENKIPFDPEDKFNDYDMRGFYKALQDKDPRAMTAINPNDQKMHFPDYWKTPYDMTFSAGSQWANPNTAPQWNDKDQLVAPGDKLVYDERKQAILRLLEQITSNKQFLMLLQQQAGQAGR